MDWRTYGIFLVFVYYITSSTPPGSYMFVQAIKSDYPNTDEGISCFTASVK